MEFFPRERPWHTWALMVMQNNDIWLLEYGVWAWSTMIHVVDPQGSTHGDMFTCDLVTLHRAIIP